MILKRPITTTIVLLFICLNFSVKAQFFQNKSNYIRFEHITEGLSQNTVTSILKDSYGFMWFGTRNGLNKYDGLKFIKYEETFQDSTSLSNSYIQALYEDSRHNLWVGTNEGGLNLYNRDNDCFVSFKHRDNDPASISDNTVMAIYEDSKGNLWIGTNQGGLNLFDPQTRTFRSFKNDPGNSYSISDNRISKIFEGRNGELWIATRNGGLNLFDRENEQFYHYVHDEENENSLSHNEIRAVYKGMDGNIWIGTQNGMNLMYRNNYGQIEFKRFYHDINNSNSIIHNAIQALGSDRYGNIWIGTENGGLSVYNHRENTFNHYFHNNKDKHSLGSNSICSIYGDDLGTIWLGPLNAGINKVDNFHSKFDAYSINPFSNNTLNNSNISCFYEDSNGDLWIGTDGGGLNRFDKKKQKFTSYTHNPKNNKSISSNAVLSIIEDSKKRIWIGTWDGGLNVFDQKTETFRHFKHVENDSNSLSDNNIFSMVIDKYDRFWIGTYYGGLDLFDPAKEVFSHLRDRTKKQSTASFSMIYKLCEDSRDNLWVGTGEGLIKIHLQDFNNPTFSYYRSDPMDSGSISGNNIISIYEDIKGTLWVGTDGVGLNKFDYKSDRFKTYTKFNGLPNDVINGILEDHIGNLWLSTNKGLSKFNPETETFRNYDVADGLQEDEFIKGAYLKTKEGEFFFGGISGFNAFYPESIKDNPHIPPVYITEFRIYNEVVKVGMVGSPLEKHIIDTKEIVLGYDQNVFSFEFSALNYSQASKNCYAFKLEGYDRDWQYLENWRMANYTKVPPGEYIFKVKGSNNDLKWNSAGAEVKVIIQPPWWSTTWAYTIYIFMIVILLYLFRLNIINRERLKGDLKLEHIELVKMQEMDQLKSNFFANISHEFRTPLTLILGPLRSIQNNDFQGDIQNQYKIMLQNGHRLLKLINQILDLSKIEAGKMILNVTKANVIDFLKPILSSFNDRAQKKNVNYHIIYEREHIDMYFDEDKLEKIVFNLLSNAFNFTPEEGSIFVKIGAKFDPAQFPKGSLEIEIEDTGIGIPESEIKNIFNRFYQVSGNHEHRGKGTGIGLSLTKELIELHKGKIEVSSQIDQGTVFKVQLPLGKSHLKNRDIKYAGAERTLSEENYNDIEEILNQAGEEEEISKKVIAEPDSRSILLIEDNHQILSYLREQLQNKYLIFEAKDGKSGYKVAVNKQPNLIISDIMMPGMNGLELCKKVKSNEMTSHIPVILLTAKAGIENETDGFEVGADYYVTKPFNFKLLELKIRNILHSREQIKEHCFSNKTSQLEPSQINLSSKNELFMKKAIECIERNMSDSSYSVEDFGRDIGFSRMQLYRKLKELTGQSANEFIRSIRMKRAAQLLEQNQLTIAEITYQVGFNDLQYFRVCFKKEFGVNPSEYASCFISN